MSQHYTYTAADIERYHSGKMSAQDMHAIEKAAMEDPFLADALEGYVHTATPVKDVAELRERLFAKKKKKNVFFLMSKQNAWLRIAAMFILIAGIGYLAWQLNSSTEKSELAITQDSTLPKNTASEPVAKPDSLINEKESMAVTTPAVTRNGNSKQENTLPKTDIQSAPTAYEKPKEYLQDQTMQTAMLRQLQKAPGMNVLKGRIVDSLGNPVRYATVRDMDKKLGTTSDSTGRFILVTNDSSLTAVVSAVGYKSRQRKLSDKEESVIVIEPANQNLNEVVVTASGIRRSEKALGYAVTKVKPEDVAAMDSIMKFIKERNPFTEYVRKNIKIPTDGSGKNYKGTVLLSFGTNKKGTPKKIKVVQSLCAECDKEAIRLLISGPKWKYSKARQVVPIQF